MLLHDRRASGKTTQAMAWVSNGERIDRYPGWSRVLVVHTRVEHERLRREWGSWVRDHETGDRVQRLVDFDHRVYTYDAWAGAVGVDPDVEVCIDNLDVFLGRHVLTPMPGWIAAATITAEPWENQTFHESVHQRPGARG